MAIAFVPNNTGKVLDLTNQIVRIPNQWGLINQLGLFNEQGVTQDTVAVSQMTEQDGLPIDRNWDERNSTIKPTSRGIYTFPIPHFPLDTAILPRDLQGIISWENFAQNLQLETAATVRARKMNELRKRYERLMEVSRMQIITTGSVYAPSGTLARPYGPTVNFYNEFGVTRTEIEMDLSNVNVDPMQYTGEILSTVQDGLLNGQVAGDIMVIASPEFFEALITNPYITEVYKYYARPGADPLTQYLNADSLGLDRRYRSFELGGVTFVEYRGTYTDQNGVVQRFIPAGDAYAFPMGVQDMFQSYFAPALRFDTVNTVGQKVYYFEYMGEKMDKIEVMSESNVLNAVLRPEAIIRLYLAP